MNEIKCGVVRDLMPLVADEVASEESRELVQMHMETCETCKAYYEGMTSRVFAETAQPEETAFIRFCRRMEKRFKMKRVLIILIAAAVLLGGLGGAMFFFETRNYSVAMEQEDAKAQLYLESNGDVACRIEMAEGKNWYGMLHMEMRDGRYYLTPYRPTYTFMNSGYGGEAHEFSLDLVWQDDQLHYRVDEWDMFFNEETGAHEEHRNERLIPIEYVRWGQPDEYTTIYEKGDILPTYDELLEEGYEPKP